MSTVHNVLFVQYDSPVVKIALCLWFSCTYFLLVWMLSQSRLACVRAGDGCLLLIICIQSYTQALRRRWVMYFMTILTTIVILIASLFWTLALKLAIQGILLRAWLISHIMSYYRIYRKNRSPKVAWLFLILSWPRIMFFKRACQNIFCCL